MKQSPQACDLELLRRSIEEQLPELTEDQLAVHLSECDTCRAKLHELAGDQRCWMSVSDVLRNELQRDSNISSIWSALSTSEVAPSDANSPFGHGSGLRPSDFIVDFLLPSQSGESIGRLGNIEILKFIGQGAHGVVLKGVQAELNRVVAVKVMAPHLANVAAARKRFAREARATAAIVHPNVLPIWHVDTSGQLPYLVMPYVDCESLQDRLDRVGALPLLEVLRISVQIAKGLSAAHAQGLVHRDVKPANILLERGVERVMLTDFGLARAVDDATLTRSGLIAGTPHYMSPEQARGDSVDTRSDLFSLGSVLYAMCVGRPPFRAESTYGILRRVTDDTPRPIRQIQPDIPPWMEFLVHKLLNKNPESRFESASQVAELLEQSLAHAQSPQSFALPETLISHDVQRVGKKTTRRFHATLIRCFIAAVVVAMMGFVLVWGINHSNRSVTELDRSNSTAEHATQLLEPSKSAVTTVSSWDDGIDRALIDVERELDQTLLETLILNP
jgi:serine/threonine protein kinase